MTRARDIADLGQDKATLAGYVDTGVTSTDLERIDITTEGTSENSKVVTADSSGHVTLAGELRGPATLVIDPATVGDATGTLHVKGGLQVDGTTTTLNSTNLQVDDKLIELAHTPSGSEGNDTAVDGGGIILKSSDSDKSITWTNSTDTWDFNQGINVTGGATVSDGLTVGNDFTVDTDTLKANSTTNRVGVGIASPTSKLHIYDSADHARLSLQCANSSGRHWQLQARNDGVLWLRDDTAGANRMVFNTSGSVGIGSTSPDTATGFDSPCFEVAGSEPSIVLSKTGADSIAIVNHSSTLKFINDTDDRAFFHLHQDAPANSFVLNSSGNVGIGITPESGISADASSLQVGDLLSFSAWTGANANDFHALSYNAYKTGSDSWKAQRTSSSADYRPSQYAQAYGQHYFRVATSATEDSAISFSNAMTIDNSGNVGIGTASPTSDGGTTLEIYNATTPTLRLNDGGDYKALIQLRGNDTEIRGSSGNMEFYTGNADGASSTNRMTINSSGNVGIGTSSPSRLLHVYGAGTGTEFYDGHVILEGTNASNPVGIAYINRGNVSSYSDLGHIRMEIDSGNAKGKMTFSTRNSDGNNTDTGVRMTIKSDGKVGIGTTSPSNLFHCKTTATAGNAPRIIFESSEGNVGASDELVQCYFSGDSDVDGNAFYIRFRDSDSYCGGITSDGASSVGFDTSSDYRLKENITELTNGLERVLALKPKRFNLIGNKNKEKRDGFIAHEVTEASEENSHIVTGQKDAVFMEDGKEKINPQSLDYSKFTPMLVAAIQELSAKVTALESA